MMALRRHPLPAGQELFVNAAGRFFLASQAARKRIDSSALLETDRDFLQLQGHVLEPGDTLGHLARGYAEARRAVVSPQLDYLILVPTLRCDLSCSYCQVSRVAATQPGYDWSEDTVEAVLRLLDMLATPQIKIEFQGGEPTLRPDLLRRVIARCARFEQREFVICTNLQRLDDEIIALLDHPDVFISTSLDGGPDVHARNRTGSAAATVRFFGNLAAVVARYGPKKIAALPTIDPAALPDIDALIESYARHGFESIFLRPINFQGFARKRHRAVREQDDDWRAYYERFVRRLIARNWQDRSRVLEEAYLSIALRRIFRPGTERHVDLRSPNPLGIDYIVIDHDGVVYPTDEARMLARAGVIDLAIGTVAGGWDSPARDVLNQHSSNSDDPACQRCAFQPFCGRDLVDDIARYGRIDLPRHDTAFCRRHMHLFGFVFQLLYDEDEAVRYSLARWLRLPGAMAPTLDYLA
jgi:His-Xaa-Ser system radical SAM maturase HxsB